MDKRKLLRAAPPSKSSKIVQIHLSPTHYEWIYWRAFERNLSLNDAFRELIQMGKEATPEPNGEARQRPCGGPERSEGIAVSENRKWST